MITLHFGYDHTALQPNRIRYVSTLIFEKYDTKYILTRQILVYRQRITS
jgi:hypothetical protein